MTGLQSSMFLPGEGYPAKSMVASSTSSVVHRTSAAYTQSSASAVYAVQSLSTALIGNFTHWIECLLNYFSQRKLVDYPGPVMSSTMTLSESSNDTAIGSSQSEKTTSLSDVPYFTRTPATSVSFASPNRRVLSREAHWCRVLM